MVKLMNSAMMPIPGNYNLTQIDKKHFVAILLNANNHKFLESYIGYQQNVDLIKEWSGIEVELNRAQTSLVDGDSMLIMRLKYRPENQNKGKEVDEDDFEFFIANFTATT